jgi:hypothetical protein
MGMAGLILGSSPRTAMTALVAGAVTALGNAVTVLCGKRYRR